MKIKADIQTRTAADPLPDNLRKTVFMIHADVRTNVSQVGASGGPLGANADDACPSAGNSGSHERQTSDQ